MSKNKLLRRDSISYVYCIIMIKEAEEFIKIGYTTNPSQRFTYFMECGYECFRHFIYSYKNINDSMGVEWFLHTGLDRFKYTPKDYFSGYTECFTLEALEEIKNL